MQAPMMTREISRDGSRDETFVRPADATPSVSIGHLARQSAVDGKLERTPPTLRDVADRAGVSPMTVSRAINRTARVSPRTQEAVQRAIAELGYVLNASAQTLARRETNRIALVLDERMPSHRLGQLLLGAVEECSRRNLQLITQQICNANALLESLASMAVKGVIIAGPLPDEQRLVCGLVEKHMPIVCIAPDRDLTAALSISIDNRRAAFDMTSHLLDLGIPELDSSQAHHGASVRCSG